MFVHFLGFMYGVDQRFGQTKFAYSLEVELHQLFAYVLERMHFLLTAGLAGREILLGIIFWFFLHGGLFNAALRNCYHTVFNA